MPGDPLFGHTPTTMTIVLFDVDGTLLYADDHRDSHCFARVYEAIYGQPFPSIDWARYPHVNDTTIFKTVIAEHFQRTPSSAEMAHFHERYLRELGAMRQEAPQHFKEVPGAVATLAKLQADPHFAIAIATGGWAAPAELKLQHIGAPLANLPICGADGKHTREEVINAALETLADVQPRARNIVYIGDAHWDVQTTRRMNLNFLGIAYRSSVQDLLQWGATQVLVDFSDYTQFTQALALATPPRARG